ncbi:MAG: hypothetical protein KatS3mg108_0593 [Isosphaeraceae bacterium]|jgi:hypothetical protein|nr:MAG: hypothetical protein KatS3mg108_0593 [Isosphaeraceae bacterium]
MNQRFLIALGLAVALLEASDSASGDEPSFQKHAINPRSIFEAAGAFDVDGDGDIDVVSGSTWYEAPHWTPHRVRDVEQIGTYMNCFSTLPMDVDGDGDTDFVSVSYFSKSVGWVENPGVADQPWTYHEIDQPGPSETAVRVDLTGDGRPEILPNTVNVVVFYELEKPGSEPIFKKYDLGSPAAGHGVGTGDMNGDGRLDLLTPKGWFEAPSDPSRDSWTWHGDWDLGVTGIQILGRDVDGDGDTDLIHGMGHDIGLYWSEQIAGPDGKPAWKRHLIDDSISSVHTLVWADLDGDGQDNELITGKRVYSHEVEPGDVGAPVVAYYRFNPAKPGWDRYVIFQGEPASNAPADGAKRDAQKDFPPGTAGTGLELTAVDLDGDGDVDLVCPGKTGLYWFENRLR